MIFVQSSHFLLEFPLVPIQLFDNWIVQNCCFHLPGFHYTNLLIPSTSACHCFSLLLSIASLNEVQYNLTSGVLLITSVQIFYILLWQTQKLVKSSLRTLYSNYKIHLIIFARFHHLIEIIATLWDSRVATISLVIFTTLID